VTAFVHPGSAPREFLCLTGLGWRRSATGRTLDLRSPIDDRLLGRIQAMSAEEAGGAIELAAKSYGAWAERPVSERADVLHRAASLLRARAAALAELLIDEIGKTRKSGQTPDHAPMKGNATTAVNAPLNRHLDPCRNQLPSNPTIPANRSTEDSMRSTLSQKDCPARSSRKWGGTI